MAVFVLDKRGKPLMPCSEKRARLLLQRGRARVHRAVPFVLHPWSPSTMYREHDWDYEGWARRADARDAALDLALAQIRKQTPDAGAASLDDALARLYESDALAHELHRALFAFWRAPEPLAGPALALRDLLTRALEAEAEREALA